MLYPQLLFCAPVWCYSYPNPVPQVLVLVHYLRGSHWLPLSHQKWGDDTDFVSQTSSLWYFLYRTRFQLHLPQLAQQYFRPTARLNWAFFSSFDWVYSCSGCYRWVWRGVTVVIPSLVLLSSILTLQIPSLTHLQLCSPFFSFLNLSALSFFFVFFYLVLPLPLNQPFIWVCWYKLLESKHSSVLGPLWNCHYLVHSQGCFTTKATSAALFPCCSPETGGSP